MYIDKIEMKIKICLLLFCACFSENLCSNFLYEISDEDYYKLPELFVLDHYEKCLSQKDTVFCVGTFELQDPRRPSQVYDKIMRLTKDTIINFNHTKLYRGKCLGSIGTCPINDSISLAKSFENCIDRDINKDYGLRAHLSNFDYCKNRDDKRKVDTIDVIFMTYMCVIILFNCIGTTYDISKGNKAKALKYSWLLAFSLRENWKKLTNKIPPGHNFLCFHGMRAILTILVHITHTIVGLAIGFIPNPRYLELVGDRPEFVILFNGTVVIQTFVVMTSFLRTLKTFGEADKTKSSYKSIMNAVVDRYVRISPTFLTAVGLSATLVPYLGDGPLWRKYVEGEAELCRDTFWRQFFLIQNFYPPSCHPQAWYLSVDFQVYLITTLVTVYLMRRKDKIPQTLLSLLAASLVIVFTIVFFLELKPSLQIMNPENLLTLFKFEKSFTLLYQSLWGNLPSAIIGILSACLYLQIKKSNYDLKTNKLFVFAFRMTIPLAFAYGVVGIFFLYSMTAHLTVSIYATIDKPVYAAIMGVFILGCIFKVEDLYRNVIEWHGWVVLSRLSLSALLMHIIVGKVLVANRIYPLNASVANVLSDGLGVSALTFIVSLPLALMVEYPFIQLYKTMTAPTEAPIASNDKAKDN